MASKNYIQATILRYDHQNILMENLLRYKEYWQVVSNEILEPTTSATDTEVKGLKLKDLEAKNYLFQVIDRSILEAIFCKDNFKHLWDFMKNKYQGLTKAKRQQLEAFFTEFKTLQMKFGESITNYFEKPQKANNPRRV